MAALMLDDDGLEAALSLLDEYDNFAAQHHHHQQMQHHHTLTQNHHQSHHTTTTTSSSGGSSSKAGSSSDSEPPPTATDTGDTASSTAGTKPNKSRKRPMGFNSNHARDERRKELIYLRQKVAELEAQLGQLQRLGSNEAVSSSNLLLLPPSQQNALQQLSINTWSQHSSSNRAAIAAAAGATSEPPAPAPSLRALSKESVVWKELATRQHAEREKAEMENIRLKLILEEQIKIAKNLHTMLTKKTTAKLVESFGLGTSASRTPAAAPSADDKSIFEDLLRTAEHCYSEIDSVFEANGLGKMETSYRDAQIKVDETRGTFLEIVANKVMPFDMEATATAVWQHMTHSMQNIPLRFYYEKHPQKMETTDDTVLERIGAELYVNGKKADFQVKQIIRRYVEKDRVVLIWGAHIDSLEFCDEPTAGIRFREKGYLMIKRPTSMSSEFTLLQTCYIITPELGEDVHAKDPTVGALTEFVLNSTAWNITASHQMIENVLLDQSFRNKRARS